MSTNTTPDLAAAIAVLVAAAGQTQTAAPAAPERTMLTVKEAADFLRCSESLIYTQMKDGRLRGVKVGRRRLVPMAELRRIVEGDAAA